MASKKDKIDNGDLVFDSELDFNFDDNFDTLDPSKNKKKRKPIHDVVRGTKDAAKSKLKSGSFWNNVAKKALPRSYGVIVEEALKSKEVMSETTRDIVRTLKPDMQRIGRQVDMLVPEESRRIKKWTSKFKDKDKPFSGASAEELQNQAISQAQMEIFGKLQQHSDAKEARDRSEQRVRDKIDAKRFIASTNILGAQADGISKIAAYTTTVNAAFQKKSLELQYRSYFVQAEMLKSNVKYSELFKAYFEAIKENTALPDFVKITKSEMLKQYSLNKLFGGIQSGVSAGLKRVGRKLGDYARGARDRLSDISMGLDQAGLLKDQMQMAKELGMDESALYHGANTAGGFLIDMMVDRFGPKLRKFFPHNGRVSQGLASAARFMRDPTHQINKLQEREGYKRFQQRDGILGDLGRFGNMLLNEMKTPGMDRGLTKGSAIGSALRPYFFSEKAHRSLTEVIPGYLARILQETTAIRKGSKELEPMAIFNYQNGRFTNAKSFGGKIESSLLKSSNAGVINWRLHEVAKGLTGQAVSGEQAKRIKEFLHTASLDTNMNYASSSMFNSAAFNRLLPEDQKLLKDQITKLHGTEQGKLFMTDTMTSLRESTSAQVAGGMKQLHDLIKEGYAEELIRKGLIRKNKDGGYDVNMGRLTALFRSKGVKETAIKPEEVKRFIIPRGEDEPRMTTSDQNVKESIKTNRKPSFLAKLLNLDTYRYKYKKRSGHDDGQMHQGFMAQKVRKEFGEDAAPGGVKIDMSYMTAANTEAIKELHQNQMGGPVAIRYLASIDRRLAEMSTLGKIHSGINPESGESKGLFGDTVNLGRRYVKTIVGHGSKTAMGAASIGMRAGRSVGGFAKDVYDRNKDRVADAGQRLISDAMTLVGWGYQQTRNVVSNIVPNAIKSVRNALGKVSDKMKDFLSKPRDFYIPGMPDKPIIIGELFKNGYYVDENGKPFLTVDDLKKATGNIYNRAGKLVVTAAQMAEGLYDEHGNKLKHLITNLKDVALAGAGYVGTRLLKGLSKVKDVAKNMFAENNIFSRMYGSVKTGVNSVLGKFQGGLGIGRSARILDEILKIMKKWDARGFGSGGGGSNLGMAAAMAAGMGGPTAAGGVPEGQPGQGFAAMGAARDIFRGARNTFNNVRNTQFGQRLGGIFQGKAQRFGKLFGGRLGRLGGRLGGALSGLGSMFGGGGNINDPFANGFMGPTPNTPAAATKPASSPGFFSRMMNMGRFSSIPAAMRSWNDPNGTGRRAGDQFTRLEEMAMRDAERKQAQAAAGGTPAPEARYQNGGQALGGLANMLKNGFGDIFKLAGGVFNSLSSVGKGIFGLLKIPGVAGRGLGKVGGVLGKIGSPIAKGLEKLGVGKVAAKFGLRGLAGFAARRAGTAALLTAADMALTGGLGGTLLTVGAGAVTALGSILASPVVLGGLAVGAAAYGGYKLFKYLRRDNVDDFQKFRYMQYGFGSTQGDEWNHKLSALEYYLLNGNVGYQAQEKGPKIAYLLEKKIDPAEIFKAFDVNTEDEDEVQMFTGWFQNRFKPFFLNTLTALHTVNPKINLFEAADKLDGKERTQFLSDAKFASSPAYDYTQPPVKSLESLGSYRSEVMSAVDALIAATDKKSKDGEKSATGDKKTSTWDKVKNAASYLIPGYGLYKAGKNIISAIKDSGMTSKAKEVIGDVVDSASDTGKKLLKYLEDKNIPLALKQTVLGFGSSVMATMPKLGDKLMNAAMLALGPAGLITAGAKTLLNTETGKKVKEGLSNAYDKVKNFASNAASTVSNVASSVYGAGRALYGKAIEVTSQGIESAANFIAKNYDKLLGFISSKYESGRRGVATISSGTGDAGGVSYGRFQLASKNGSMDAFLSSPEGAKYAGQFQGLRAGTKEFNAKYMEIVNMDAEGFDKAQHDYISRTHYDVAYDKLNKAVPDLNLSKRGRAVQEAIFSTAVQYGPASKVLIEALKGQDVKNMTDEQVVSAIQDYKAQTVSSKFRSSSSAVQQSVLQRVGNEKMDLIALARRTESSSANKVANTLAAATGTSAANDPSFSQNGQYVLKTDSAGSSASAISATNNGMGGIVKTSLAATAVSPLAGDSASKPSGSNVVKMPRKDVGPSAPPFTSTTTSDTRVDSGETTSQQLVGIANNALNIHKQQLDTMIEIRDKISTLVDIFSAKQQQQSVNGSPAAPAQKTTEPIKPLVDIRRNRRSA